MAKQETWKWIAVFVGLIFLASYLGYITIPGITPGQIAPPPATNNPTPPPSGTVTSTNAKWNIRDEVSKIVTASGDTAYVSICKANNGYFDFLIPAEETEFDAAPDTSAGTYSTGDSLVFAVSSDDDVATGYYETYPRWFYVEYLDQGATIYAFPTANPISALQEYSGGSGGYVYKVNKAVCQVEGTVQLLSGTTPYWDFGYFELYGRIAKDYLIQQITSAGVVLTTLNDGATWEDTSTEVNANVTLTGDSQDLNFELIGQANNAAFGIPTLAVQTTGQVKQYNAVMIWCTSATGIPTSPLFDDGWKPFDKADLMYNATFYHVLSPIIPNVGSVLSVSIPISISDTGLSASTEYNYGAWVLDWQVESDVARGATTTSLPGYNGFLTEVGCDSIVEPLALTVSSGNAATPQLYGYFTTNA